MPANTLLFVSLFVVTQTTEFHILFTYSTVSINIDARAEQGGWRRHGFAHMTSSSLYVLYEYTYVS